MIQAMLSLTEVRDAETGRHSRRTQHYTKLLAEAKALARLNHPNVVAVHDVGEVGEEIFIAMELVDGEDLASLLHSAPEALRQEALEPLLVVGTVAHRPAVLEIEEMVVRSTRTPSLLRTTPYPLNIELQDQISRSHAVTVPDALQRVPGVALVRDGTWETALAIRGMSRSNIVTVVDDARIETSNDIAGPLSLVNVHDLERVEVLKSPASAQHGSGAIGGVVNLVSKRPLFSEGFQTSGEMATDYTTVDGGFSQYGAVDATTDRIAARISGSVRHAKDTQTPAGPLANSHYNDFSLSGSLGAGLGAQQKWCLHRGGCFDCGRPGQVLRLFIRPPQGQPGLFRPGTVQLGR